MAFKRGCRFFCSNKWWDEPDKKTIAKNLGVRFTWAILNVLKTLKSYTVVLAILLGILLVVFAAWLVRTSDHQERKIREPLLATDAFIDDVVDGLNFMTQEAPNICLTWVNGTIRDIGNTGANSVTSVSDFISSALNRMLDGTEASVNRIAAWGASQVGRSYSNINLPNVNIPGVNLHPNWAPPIQNLDLSSIIIPPRGFSVDDELYPFVRKVYDIPRTTAYYANIIGIILLSYAGIRLFLALINAFIPRPDFMWCCGISCGRITAATGKGFVNAGNQLAKPWIHVPITVGVCIILMVVLFLNPGIDKLSEDIRIPLREADKATAAFFALLNVYIEKLPEEVIEFLNVNVARISLFLVEEAQFVIDDDIFPFVNNLLAIASNTIQDACNQLGFTFNPQITTFTPGVDRLVLPTEFIPPVPPIPVDELLIPLDLVAIEKPIGPWVDDRMDEIRGIANTILMVGIWLVVLPGCVVAFSFLKAYTPKQLNEFMDHPDFFEEKPAPEEKDLELESEAPNTKPAPPPRKSYVPATVEISEPKLVQHY